MPGSSGLTKICLNTSGVRRYFSIGKPGKASKIPHGICLSSLARKASGDPRSLISKPSKATRNVIDGSGGVVKGDRCPCATARRCRGMEIEAISAKSVSNSFRAGRGPAIVAVAAFILTAVYHMIEDRTTYQGPAAITLSAAAPTGKKHVGQTFGEPRLRSRAQAPRRLNRAYVTIREFVACSDPGRFFVGSSGLSTLWPSA